MKKIATTLALFWSLLSFAQTALTEVTLISLGCGNSQEEAISNAVANVVEQTIGTVIAVDGKGLYNEKGEGVFRLPIYNKPTSELWKKAKESSGIIAKSEVLLSTTLPNQTIIVSVLATVVIDNIVTFLNSQGVQANWMGNSFTLPIKIRELKERNERCTLIDLADLNMSSCIFNLELIPDSLPKKTIINDVSGYLFLNTVNIYPTEYSDFYYNVIHTMLGKLSLSKNEVEEYNKSGLKYSILGLSLFRIDRMGNYSYYYYSDKAPHYYLRCDESALQDFIKNTFGRVIGDALFSLVMDVETATPSDNLRFYYTTNPEVFCAEKLGRWLVYSEYCSFDEAKINAGIPLCHEALKEFINYYYYNDDKWIAPSTVSIPFFNKFKLVNSGEKEIITSIKVPYFIMESDMTNVMGFSQVTH